MTDLFVSYKSEDRARVAPLVAALEADGVGIWWDARIGGGSAWRDTIESELNAARCVLVVWSQRSTGQGGSFVRDEATRSLRRGAYLPVRIDPVEPPLGFGETQALSLIGWKGNRRDPAYRALLAAVQTVIADKPRPIPPAYQPKRGVDRRLVLGGSAAAVMAAAGAGGWWALHRGASADGDSVAVLPFENLSGDPKQAYFSDGIAEELRGALTRVNKLKVAARASSELMRDADVATAAAKLGVANIVTGSVNRGDGTIRINAELIDGQSGLSRWSQSYDRPIGDALAIQTGIAENVAGALQIALGRAEKALLSLGGTSNPVAQDAYLRGGALGIQSKLPEALAAYDTAVTADPAFALAHAARARTRLNLARPEAAAVVRMKSSESEAEARRAITLAPGLGYPLAVLGFILDARVDLRGAANAYAAAYRASPGDAAVLRDKASFDARMTGSDAAIALVRRAIALDPLRRNNQGWLGSVLLKCGRIDDAIAAFRAALAEMPGSPVTLNVLAIALLAKGQRDEARRIVATLAPDGWQRLTIDAIATATIDRAASDRALAALAALDGTQYQVAQVHAQRREPDAAFAAIARAWDMSDPGLSDFKTDPLLMPLRSDPRFGEWLRKIGFP